MKKFGLFCPIRKANPYRRMAKALKTDAVVPNHVNREFRSHGPRKVLLTDITYIRFADGFCYLSSAENAQGYRPGKSAAGWKTHDLFSG